MTCCPLGVYPPLIIDGCGVTRPLEDNERLLFPNEVIATQTQNYTAKKRDIIPCNISGGSFTVTLPSNPSLGDEVGVFIVVGGVPNTVTISNTLSGTPTIVGKNGSEGTTVLLFIVGDYVRLKYIGQSDWLIIYDGRAPHTAEMTGDNTTGQTINHNTTTVIDFTIETYDNAGLASTSTNEITIRRSGRYMCTFSCGIASGAVVEQWNLNLRKNGSDIRSSTQLPAAFSSNIVNNVGAILDLVATDILTCSVVQQSSDSSSKTVLLTEATRSRLTVVEVR